MLILGTLYLFKSFKNGPTYCKKGNYMNENHGWIATANQLTAVQPLPLALEPENFILQYKSLLQQWQSLLHPAILPMDEINLSSIAGQPETARVSLKIVIQINKLSVFKPSQELAPLLTTLEKLFVVKQTIDLASYVQRNGIKLVWNLSRLYLHPTGYCGWLPPLPNELINPPQGNDLREQIIRFWSELFDWPTSNWRQMQKEGQIPWEWGAFGEYYWSSESTQTADQQIDMLNFFSLTCYQAWLYNTANRLGLKDNLLTKPDYETLHQFGLTLGLTEEQMQKLDIIAQQQFPAWQDLLAISGDHRAN
jgi:hypothetical protein